MSWRRCITLVVEGPTDIKLSISSSSGLERSHFLSRETEASSNKEETPGFHSSWDMGKETKASVLVCRVQHTFQGVPLLDGGC